MGSRLIDDLADSFRLKAIELIARIVESKIAVMIVETRRTEAEHQQNLANGTSWTKHSKHIDGLAIDLCPYSVYDLHGPDKLQWNSDDPAWKVMGNIGKRLSLRWGGDWERKDMGHFEME